MCPRSVKLEINSVNPDRKLHSAVYDMGLH